jgi:succinate dehydrogenase / fumarate reductase cytochrome b subunit
MSLTGLFLITFLVVHLVGNLQLLAGDHGKAFNVYTYEMTHNPLIKVISWSLYALILLHAVQGILIAVKNRRARPERYAVGHYPKASPVAKQMALLGLLIFAFLCLHMGDFWFKLKFTDSIAIVQYAGFMHEVHDLYARVAVAFKQEWIVGAYLIGVIALALHLWHGFDSAFQSLGLRHMRFGYLFGWFGRAYSIVIPVGFAVLPLYFYFIR